MTKESKQMLDALKLVESYFIMRDRGLAGGVRAAVSAAILAAEKK